MRTAKTLIWLGGCPGWFDYSLGAHWFGSFCHAAAHIIMMSYYESACISLLFPNVVSATDRSMSVVRMFCFVWVSGLAVFRVLIFFAVMFCIMIPRLGKRERELVDMLLEHLFVYFVCITFWFEPCFIHMRTTKAQMSLRIRAFWSAPLLVAA